MTWTTVSSWLLTYLLHSTILLGAALLVSLVLKRRGLAIQEVVLRTALVGGVLTATAQMAFGIAPLTGALDFDATQSMHGISAIPPAESEVLAAYEGAEYTSDGSHMWTIVFLAAWGAGSLLALIAVLRSIVDLRRLMLTRCFRPAGRLIENLASAMGLRRPVRISTSEAITVPFATGIRRPEICCPERVGDLAREHQTGLFAHEMAHLARRDPAWQLAYRLGEALLVLQPLNRLVRRRLEEIAEHLTDERAAACTGDRLGLARCLVVVAHWGHSEGLGLPATALAAGPRLDRRVRHLISGTTGRRIGGRWALAIGLILIAGSVVFLPAIGTVPAHAEPATWSATAERDQPGAVDDETKTWSTAEDRPETAPPAPTPPDRPHPAPAPPAPEAAPDQDTAPPAPRPAPSAGTAPAAAPASPARPADGTGIAPPAPPAQPAPPVRPEEAARERERARRTAREDAARRRQSEHEQRARAVARSREACELSIERAEQRRAAAEDVARQRRLSDAQRDAMRRQAREMRSEAVRIAREESLAQREQTRALGAEARALAREAAEREEEITHERREELYRRALEIRARTEIREREIDEAHRERAKALADQARKLAEQAEAERRRQADQER